MLVVREEAERRQFPLELSESYESSRVFFDFDLYTCSSVWADIYIAVLTEAVGMLFKKDVGLRHESLSLNLTALLCLSLDKPLDTLLARWVASTYHVSAMLLCRKQSLAGQSSMWLWKWPHKRAFRHGGELGSMKHVFYGAPKKGEQ